MRTGGIKVSSLSADLLQADPTEPDVALMVQAEAQRGSKRLEFASQQSRDLCLLASDAFAAMAGEPQHAGLCQVWEGEGYGDYYGRLHGQVLARASYKLHATHSTRHTRKVLARVLEGNAQRIRRTARRIFNPSRLGEFIPPLGAFVTRQQVA